MNQHNSKLHAETICAHFGEDPSLHNGAVIPPIYQNSIFVMDEMEQRAANYSLDEDETAVASGMSKRYDYTRVGNPTTDVAESKIAALEGAESARCFSSGMAAITAAILSCVKAGDHIVCVQSVYGPTRTFVSDYLVRFGITTTYVQGSDPQEFEDALQPTTRLIFVESPSSVVMQQQDLESVAKIAKQHGAATIIDNSWASPIFQNPMEFGIDLVCHSATKYLGGHSDIIAGVVCGSRKHMDPIIRNEGLLLGAVMDPFASWLMIRGLRTLPVRMAQHQRNTAQIVKRLEEHSAIARVYYPGSADDSQPELTSKQLKGKSGLLSIELKNSTKATAYKLVNTLKYFQIACSWGGFESLALPHHAQPRVFKDASEPRWLVRLHIGLENVEDLWEDLDAGLNSIH